MRKGAPVNAMLFLCILATLTEQDGIRVSYDIVTPPSEAGRPITKNSVVNQIRCMPILPTLLLVIFEHCDRLNSFVISELGRLPEVNHALSWKAFPQDKPISIFNHSPLVNNSAADRTNSTEIIDTAREQILLQRCYSTR